MTLPSYRDLPRAGDGNPSAWHLGGHETGMLGLITSEQSAAAAQLVKRGAVFPLDLPVGAIDPPLFERGAPRHTWLPRGNAGFDDLWDNVYPQAGSQWDALAHFAAEPGIFYNGATMEDIRQGARTVQHWANRGIVTRAVILDVAEVVAERGEPGESIPITVDDLESARSLAGLDIRPGDVLVVHTGFVEWHRRQDRGRREAMAGRTALTATGIEHTEEMVSYLWDLHISAIASDAPTVEVWPRTDEPFCNLHQILIGRLGIALGELWSLTDLVADCHADGRYEAMLTSAPLNAPGSGSPANALAIK